MKGYDFSFSTRDYDYASEIKEVPKDLVDQVTCPDEYDLDRIYSKPRVSLDELPY